jgi:hypothetical protein
LSVPFFVAFSVGLGLFIESRQDHPLPVGYVDQAGLLAASQFPPGSNAARLVGQGQSEFIAYANEEAARAALEKLEVQVYFVMPDLPDCLDHTAGRGEHIPRQEPAFREALFHWEGISGPWRVEYNLRRSRFVSNLSV